MTNGFIPYHGSMKTEDGNRWDILNIREAIKHYQDVRAYGSVWYALEKGLGEIPGCGRVIRWVTDAYYWVIYRTIHKYHIVHLGTKPGYSDVVERLVHANFMLLVHFVEKEKPFEHFDWSGERLATADEIKYLYHWYKNVWLKRDANDPLYSSSVELPKLNFVKIPDRPGFSELLMDTTPEYDRLRDEHHEYESRIERECEENLIRLAKIRQYLWT